MTLTTPRRSTFPQANDNWQSIAQRELSNLPGEDAISQLQSWNLHVFMRPNAATPEGEQPNPILPTDVIFLEPPLAS